MLGNIHALVKIYCVLLEDNSAVGDTYTNILVQFNDKYIQGYLSSVSRNLSRPLIIPV